MKEYDIIIIGGGPAGLASAISAREQGISSILILEREDSLGGILNQCIHNGYGARTFNEELTGPEFAQRLIDKVIKLNIDYKLNTMVLDLSSKKTITMVNEEDGILELEAKSIILATGCREKPRGARSIPGSRCAGVYTAGSAQKLVNIDGYMPGKDVVIVGSNDVALIMARRMKLEGARVKAVIESMPFATGSKINVIQCLDDFDIPLILSHRVVDINGKDRVQGVTITEVDEDKNSIASTEEYIGCDTILLSVDLLPENDLAIKAGILILPLTGGPEVDESMQTSLQGVYSCGNLIYLHDAVDDVITESFKVGANSAKYIKSLE